MVVRLTGMLYGVMLRTPHAHANIRSIDVTDALALPGVRAVAIGDDVPDAENKIAELGGGAANRQSPLASTVCRQWSGAA